MVEVRFDPEDAAKVEGVEWTSIKGVPAGVVEGKILSAVEAIGLGDAHPKNGDWTDLRRENLVVGAESVKRKNTYKGVYYKTGSGRKSGRWAAQVSIRGKLYHLGYADTEVEAARIFLEKAEAKRREIGA